ncbi:kinesin-like protein KIN-4C isoform X1 [Zingiber officinale]|uniref:kinesin-like protein KIN-4C isoform X1 n=1 Tax=Zingiber officinale TaxID=94328 RepID=UPI001C4B3954|nr:kinesin-like protein KIN-4C isoform X1 [Zingiber officinale]
MECQEEAKASQKECVKVAVNIRPLITTELLVGCTDCVTVVPGEPQVQIGSHGFTFDHVYGSSGSPYSSIFKECVLPLIEGLFHGYNATVLAYGQTGSGKTYTMGTNYTGEGNCGGIIPEVMETIFRKVDAMKATTEFLIRVSFIEIFKEEVFDLLDPQSHATTKTESAVVARPTSRAPIQIRETASGGIALAGVTEAEVRSKEEMASYLTRGSIARATASTNMNSQSSRSHAIFTIYMEQKKVSNECNGMAHNEVAGDDILLGKFHLVDLAGSERAKRTGADGLRLKEGIHINRGLLALGNVISALGDEKKRKEGGHVPYRDSKLTRLLQDSLGGNSKTVMIACISPADSNAEETINTLKYANRARNIQNKAMINRDPVAAEMQRMRSQLEQLQAELVFGRGGGASLEELQVLRHRISLLEASNAELRQELKDRQVSCDHLKQCAFDAQLEKDKLILKIELARNGKSWDEIDDTENDKEIDLLKGYASKIQELEADLIRAQSFSRPCKNLMMEFPTLDEAGPSCDARSFDDSSEAEEEEEQERDHTMLQRQLDKELQELDKRLEQKEAEMKQYTRPDTVFLKQHYEKKLLELEQEKKTLMKEIEELRFNLSSITCTSDDGAQKLKADYLQKLTMLETQVSELKKKQEAQTQLLRQKQKSDEAAKKLQEEIQRIKSQKVQLHHKMKQESEQFRSWKASREKEVLQLKKEGRRNEYEMHKLVALNQRQKMVLQRKTEEAALATKRLKELLDAKKSSRDVSAMGNANGPGIQALTKTIEDELEFMLQVHEVRSEYERQLQARAAMANERAKLKEETSDTPQTMSPSARTSRIFALDNMLKTSSTTLVAMASQLSEAEERERAFSGRGRWNQIRSLADAKNMMNYLFNLASTSRCQLYDKEVSCREKDSEVAELKDKVVKLNISKRQLEEQLMVTKNHMQKLTAQTNNNKKSDENSGPVACISEDGDSLPTKNKNSRRDKTFNQNVNNLDDMDISDSEMSFIFESEAEASDEDAYESDLDWVESGKKNRMKQSPIHQTRKSRSDESVSIAKSSETSNEEAVTKDEDSGFHPCCSCTRGSSCKTKRCECRALGSICSSYCGCIPSKCTNREDGEMMVDGDEMSVEIGRVHSHLDDDEKRKLISEGTRLLQSALSKKPDDKEVKPRMPLSDIKNVANQNPTSQARRKKWRKSTVQLVPTQPLPSSLPQNSESQRQREDVHPLRLPRAMESFPVDNNPPFGDKNTSRASELAAASDKETTRSMIPRRKSSDEKENHMQ